MTSPTAPAAGVHLPWARVPAAVQDWAARFGAGPPRPCATWSGASRPAPPAFWSGPAGPSSSRRSGSELNPDSPGHASARDRDLVRLAAVGPLPPAARHLRRRDLGGAGLRGGAPGDRLAIPGRPTSWAGWRRALAGLHDELTPSPGAGLRAAGRLLSAPSSVAGPSFAGPGSPPRPRSWARAHLDRLAELEASWPAACAGSTLVHGDVRSDNVLLRRRRGLRRLAPCRGGEPGLRPRRLGPLGRARGRSRRPRRCSRSTDRPGGSIPTSSRCLLAAVAGFFVAHSLRPPPPGLPTLRPFQAAQGEVALAWLRRRTGW